MTYRLILLCAALTFVGRAAVASESAAGPDLKAKIQAEAEKTCSDDLDHDRFGNYATMEECVSDKAQKLLRTEQAASVAGARVPQRN